MARPRRVEKTQDLKSAVTGFLLGNEFGETQLTALRQYLGRFMDRRIEIDRAFKDQIENLTDRNAFADWLLKAEKHGLLPFD